MAILVWDIFPLPFSLLKISVMIQTNGSGKGVDQNFLWYGTFLSDLHGRKMKLGYWKGKVVLSNWILFIYLFLSNNRRIRQYLMPVMGRIKLPPLEAKEVPLSYKDQWWLVCPTLISSVWTMQTYTHSLLQCLLILVCRYSCMSGWLYEYSNGANRRICQWAVEK